MGFHAHGLISGTLLVALGLLAPSSGLSQDELARLRENFRNESNAVRKAKSLAALGDQQFKLMRKQVEASDYEGAVGLATEYLEWARGAHAALKAAGKDAEKSPNGYKQLEIQVRKSIRELDDTIHSVPLDQKAPFEGVRHALDALDKELINALFPRQPGRRPEEKPPGKQP